MELESAPASVIAGGGKPKPGTTRTYVRNVFITTIRLGVFAGVGLLLPAFLVHHLSVQVYGGWILILQISSYIGYLDFGAQNGVAKYVAQYAALHDREACDQHATAGVAFTTATGFLGILLSIALALSVPLIFPEMPPAIRTDVSHGVFLVGISTAILLASSSFGGLFLGLQRFSVPVSISIANKVAIAIVLVIAVLQHRSLTMMGAGVALINVVTAATQFLAWRILLPSIRVGFTLFRWSIFKRMLEYCAVLGLWTAGMLIISGIDTTIVGHYDFVEVAFYATAAVPVTFINQILWAVLNPLMPATSSLSVTRTPAQVGAVMLRATRYTVLLLEAAGLPIMLFGFSLLSAWVGSAYASRSLELMRILIFANIIRSVCAPYAYMVAATGMQRLATLSGICEAAVNLLSSVLLGKYLGAVGVAMGTLIGAIVGVLIHFLVSMRNTQAALPVHRTRFLLNEVLRPGIASLPTLLLLPLFWKPRSVSLTLEIALVWAIVSLLLSWRCGLLAPERLGVANRLRNLISGLRIPAHSATD